MSADNVDLNEMLKTPGEVFAALTKALQAQDKPLIEICISRARQLNLDPAKYGVLKKGEEFLKMLRDLNKAQKLKEVAFLDKAIEVAGSLGFESEEVEKCRKLRKRISTLSTEAKLALQNVEVEEMKRIVEEAQTLEFLNEDILKMFDILKHTTDEKLVQLQLKAAIANKDTKRVALLTIQIKDIFFEKMGDMFVFHKFPKLRTPSDFADSKKFASSSERDELAQTFSWFYPKPLHTSLINDASFVKEAKNLSKLILGYMGDKKLEKRQIEIAQEIVEMGLENTLFRVELYCQLVKQLTHNPSTESRRRGWEIMYACLDTFPPGVDLENYLEMWLRKNAPDKVGVLELFHSTILAGAKKSMPSENEIIRALEGKSTRLNVDEDLLLAPMTRAPSASVVDRLKTSKNLDKLVSSESPSGKGSWQMERLSENAEVKSDTTDNSISSPVVSPSASTSPWKSAVDPESGRTYYYNSETKESVWLKPEGLVE